MVYQSIIAFARERIRSWISELWHKTFKRVHLWDNLLVFARLLDNIFGGLDLSKLISLDLLLLECHKMTCTKNRQIVNWKQIIISIELMSYHQLINLDSDRPPQHGAYFYTIKSLSYEGIESIHIKSLRIFSNGIYKWQQHFYQMA